MPYLYFSNTQLSGEFNVPEKFFLHFCGEKCAELPAKMLHREEFEAMLGEIRAVNSFRGDCVAFVSSCGQTIAFVIDEGKPEHLEEIEKIIQSHE